ncbi:MAG: hypothetical protein ACXAC7_19690, partial [Candidatus Hodarchaeales archaeon]
MTDLPFIMTEYPTTKTLTIEFSSNIIKSDIIENNQKQNKEMLRIKNSLYEISDKKAKIMEAESKEVFSIRTGIFTKSEIETAQLILQADEILVDFKNSLQIEKAYQNFMEQLVYLAPSYFAEGESNFESWLILVSLPFIQNDTQSKEIRKNHLIALKSLGFVYIS